MKLSGTVVCSPFAKSSEIKQAIFNPTPLVILMVLK